MLTTFFHRYTDIVREGHSVFGMLPGFYDGWLLDREGEVKDPFTRVERVAALGMNVSIDLLVRYWGVVACGWGWNKWVKDRFRWWDSIVIFVVGQALNHAAGHAKCKRVLQAEDTPQNTTLALLWSAFLSTVTATFFFLHRDDPLARSTLKDWLPSFAKAAVISEPISFLGLLTVSWVTGRPFGGVSYKKRTAEAMA